MTSGFGEVRSLYLHIPFCERKCEYCDFTSVAGATGSEQYMEALGTEVRRLGERLGRLTLDTVFIGGGTPSLVEPALLADAGGHRPEHVLTSRPAQSSRWRRTRRASATDARAVWKDAGVNRISIGVQSLEADALRFLGRVHDADRAIAAVGEVRDAGFTSINCDLIYAVPGLGDARWRRTLQRVAAAGPTHISCYELTVEPGTPLHTQRPPRTGDAGRRRPLDAPAPHRRRVARGRRLRPVRGEQLRACPARSAATTSCTGTTATTRRPESAPTATCPRPRRRRSGSRSTTARVSVRHWHGRGIAAYGRAIRAGEFAVTGSEPVGAEMREQERVMLGLRLREGVRVGATEPGRGTLARGPRARRHRRRSRPRHRRGARPCSTR